MLKLLNKKLMMVVNVLLFVLGVFFSIVIFFNFFNEPKDLVETSNIYGKILDDCESKAEDLGFENISQKRGKVLTIRANKVENPMDIATKSSMIQNYCKKLELSKYCLGEQCGEQDFSMTLKIKEDDK